MRVLTRHSLTVLSLAAVAAFGLSACSMGAAEEETTSTTTESESTETGMEMDPAANLVGPGCAAYAEAVPEGDGSVVGMSQLLVADAASNNPLLTTLVAAVSGGLNPGVDLVDTLNSGEFTVFAPVDEAFAAVDAATVEALTTDADLLTSILTYHVIDGQILPSDLPGEQLTLNGASVTVEGSGDNLTVNGANVICGGVKTQNATVYLIDAVLVP